MQELSLFIENKSLWIVTGSRKLVERIISSCKCKLGHRAGNINREDVLWHTTIDNWVSLLFRVKLSRCLSLNIRLEWLLLFSLEVCELFDTILPEVIKFSRKRWDFNRNTSIEYKMNMSSILALNGSSSLLLLNKVMNLLFNGPLLISNFLELSCANRILLPFSLSFIG